MSATTTTKAPRVLLEIKGMHCAGCVAGVQKALESVPGVSGAHVNLALGQAAVEFAAAPPDGTLLTQAVAGAGYGARVLETASRIAGSAQDHTQHEVSLSGLRLAVAAVLLLPLVVAHFLPAAGHGWIGWATLILASVMQIYVGGPYMLGALSRLKHGATNMDTLIALGTGAAFLGGVAEFFSGSHGMSLMDAGMILTFVTLGKYLEARAKARASHALRKLLLLAPPFALVLRGSQTQEVPVEQVLPGEIILIRPGDVVPLDGVVLSGESDVSQAWLTGEPLPVDKSVGDAVHAGTINGTGALEVRVTTPAAQTWLAKTVELVRQAQESKADVERLADRVVAWFVPAVLAIAAATLIAWSLSGTGGWKTGLTCAVAVLVVACPCALGLATPAAVLVGSGRGAEMGILIKNAQSLEIAGKVSLVILDKTGTVTLGRPQINDVSLAGSVSRERLLSVAAAAERLSTHPLARAVVEAADAAGATRIVATSLRVIPGQGVIAECAEGRILAGNAKLLREQSVAAPSAAIDTILANHPGATLLLVAQGGKYQGAIVLADDVAEGSTAAIHELQALGLDVQMVSGDRQGAAGEIGRRLGITKIIAEALPGDKQRIVREIQATGQIVAMVGDGINDAPALAAADLGIAIGSGADVALESADIVLTLHDLRLLPQSIRLSRAVMAVIYQNLWWALGYNVVLIPVATGLLVPILGWSLTPAMASAAMAASSVSVVLNSLRLRGMRI